MRRHFLIPLLVVGAAILGLLATATLLTLSHSHKNERQVAMAGTQDYFETKPPPSYNVNLVDPEMAPTDIRPMVMEGFSIIMQTRKYLPQYAADNVSCIHCHFAGGNTLGGINGGISLVGVSRRYPIYQRDGEVMTLADRINGCFLRSMNGAPLPVDSHHMHAMVAYLDWISSVVPKLEDAPWLGLKRLESKHVPNPERGQELYILHCCMCHGNNGEGQLRPYGLSYPPLWGPHSFNDGAGMTALWRIASFIYCNMPYQSPILTQEQALDIGAFVISQSRPHYNPPPPKKETKQK